MASRKTRTPAGAFKGRVLSKQQLQAHLLHMSGEKDASGTIDVTVERKGGSASSAFGADPTVSVRYSSSGKYAGLDRAHIVATVAPTLEGLAVASRRVTSRPRDNAVHVAAGTFSGPVSSTTSSIFKADEWIDLPDIYRAIQGAQTAREAAAWYHRPDLIGLYAFTSVQREAELEPTSHMRAALRAIRGEAQLPASEYPNAHAAHVYGMHAAAIRKAVNSDNPMDAIREAISLTRDLRGVGDEAGQREFGEGGCILRVPVKGEDEKGEPGTDEGEKGKGEGEPGTGEGEQGADEGEKGADEGEKGKGEGENFGVSAVKAERLREALEEASADIGRILSERAKGKAGTPTQKGGVDKRVPDKWETVDLTPAVARITAAARGGDELPPMRASGAPTRRSMWALKYGLTNVFTRPPQNASHRFILIDDSGSMDGWRKEAYEIATSISSLSPTLTHTLAFSSNVTQSLAIVDVPHGMKPDERCLGQGTPLCVAIEYLQNFMAGKLANATVVIITDGQSGGGRHPDGALCNVGTGSREACVAKQMGVLANTGTNYVAIMFGQRYSRSLREIHRLAGVPEGRTVQAGGDVGTEAGTEEVVSRALKIIAELSGQTAKGRG